jgi:hypothetical protein
MQVKTLFGALLAALFVTSVMADSNKECSDCRNKLDACNKASI